MDTKKRILQANLNNQGGAFSIVYEVQKKLHDEYIFDYYSVEKFLNNSVYESLKNMGSTCIGGIECCNRFLKQYKLYKSFKAYLQKNDYEYVHIHADTAWKISVYYLAAKKVGVKNVIVHSHSSGINGHYKVINYLLHILAKPIIRKANYKCACSDFAAKWMYNTTVDVSIIQNGVDYDRFLFNHKTREKIRKDLDVENKMVIGSVSDFSYPKNPEFIFQLIQKFKNDDDFKFMFVGNRDGCKLKEWVENDVTIRNVIFVGTVTNVEAYLSAMDIFILPSRFEGLPMSALEAQVSGLYTIISDRITPDTKCSKYFAILPLVEYRWREFIEGVVINYNRKDAKDYLDETKSNVAYTAEKFRMIYSSGV